MLDQVLNLLNILPDEYEETRPLPMREMPSTNLPDGLLAAERMGRAHPSRMYKFHSIFGVKGETLCTHF